LYNGAGAKQSLIVTIPPADPNNKKTPTGTIFNGSQTDFLLAPAKPAVFLFSTIDGTIAGWNPAVAATLAVTVVKTTDESSYTGLTSAFVNGKPFLYAANFNKGRVDLYEQLPRDYAPFMFETPQEAACGFIAAYDLATGKFDGLLQDASGKPLAINGVWALSAGNVSPNNSDAAAAPATEMYFTADQTMAPVGCFR
jgi:hypothetical protein